MHLQAYQCVGMASLSFIFVGMSCCPGLARSFIIWNDHHHWQAFAEDFQTPYSFMISGLSTNKPHAHSRLNTATWANEKELPGTAPWNFLNKFLGTLQQVLGKEHVFTWFPRSFSWNKMQVSTMFPRTFPGIKAASS